MNQDNEDETLLPTEFKYEQLENCFQNQDQDQIIFNLNQNIEKFTLDWKSHFYFLDQLRILNKFNKNIHIYLHNYSQIIQQSLLNLRSQIQKNANILVQELFKYDVYDKKFSQQFLDNIIPTVFLCSINSKKFIKQEALTIIKHIEKLSLNQVIFQNLCEQLENKNYKIAEISSMTIVNMVQNQYEYFLNDKNNLIKLIQLILELNQGKRSQFVKNAQQIYQIIIKNFVDFQTFIENNFDQDLQKQLNSLNQQKQQNKLDFSKFLKQKNEINKT